VSLDRKEAVLALDEIEAVVERVKASLFYRQASAALIFWGIIIAIGYCLGYAFPAQAGRIWIVVDILGVAGMVVLVHSKLGGGGGQFDWRFLSAIALFFAFGFLWSVLLGRFAPREVDAFWPTLFMFGYTIAGLWLGRAFIVIGITITALTLVGYLWTESWFDLYLAAVDGGGLVLGGVWMRRA
jgi:hypothetical protein